MAVSLGVGSSTIAIFNFFKAIEDGKIDETERRMMGVTYVVLRVAMVLIALMYIVQLMLGYLDMETVFFNSTTAVAVGFLTVVLYINAVLMTYRIMPSTFGPAIQASAWYTLGVITSIATIGFTQYSIITFLFGYACALTLATSIINLHMFLLKHRK